MKTFHERYRRLARAPLGFSSLWLADDHLVYVKGSGFLIAMAEEYKRFRLSEIEAVNLAKTSRVGTGLLLLFLVLGPAGAGSFLLLLADDLAPVAVAFVSLFFLAGLVSLGLLVRHLVLGPTCVCDLQTRLTRERIRPLNRYHRALETVRRIDRLVRESQSGIVAGTGEVPRDGAAAAFRGDGFFSVPQSVPACFAVFAFLALAALAGLHLESPPLTGGVLLLLLLASLLVVLALVAVVRRPTPESIRTVLWILLGLHFLAIGIGTVYYLFAAVREPAYTVGFTGPLEALTAVASEGGMALYGALAGLFLAMLGASLGGVVLCGKWTRRIRHAAAIAGSDGGEPAPPPPPAGA